MTDISSSWKRILDWYKANAPTEIMTLSPGADEAALEELESTLGTELPDDVRQMYRIHNGTAESGVFPYGYYLSSLEQIRTDWQRWRDGLVKGAFSDMHSHPNGPIRDDWWNTKWIPITANGGGDHDCIDLDPAEGGVTGQIIQFNHETGASCVSANGFGEFLSEFADALERGEYEYDEAEQSLFPVDE